MLSLTPGSEEKIITAVLTATSGSRTDLLFAAGSMVDGVANGGSDVDLYFIGDGEATGENTTTRKLEKNGTIGTVDGREINLSILSPVALGELAVSFQRCLASLSTGRGIAQLDSENDLKVLHRVRTGLPLLGQERLTELRRQLGTARLAEYLANVHAVSAINRLIDVNGELDAGNDDSATWMLREAAMHLAYMALALAEETNQSRKWLLRMLLRRDDLGALGQRATQLLRRPDISVRGESLELRAMFRALVGEQRQLSAYVAHLTHEKL